MKNIIFIAPPAAGKGTQAKYLSEEYNIPHISTGDLLREITNQDNEFGKFIKNELSKGNFINDDVMTKLLMDRLKLNDCSNGYILDGYPRNIEQAKTYEKILNELNYDIGNVIFLNIDKKTAIDRIINRVVCPNCGTSYNIKIRELSPKEDNKCDKCHSNLIKREDDTEEVMSARYDTYINKTSSLIDYYKNKNILSEIKIDNKTAKEVFDDIKNVLSKKVQ